MDELAVVTARWLVEHGRAHVTEATAALDRDEPQLALVSGLRAAGLDAEQTSAVVAAATARRRARADWASADELLFTRSALEQASDPAVSAWRTRRFRDAELWDLCAGVGGDALAAAANGARVTAVDLDAARLELLRHNAAVVGVDIETVHADALRVEVPRQALVHADPGRRRDGRRVRRLAEHLPPVGTLLQAHAAARGHGVVLSPAVDLDDPDLPGEAEAELEFVQVGPDLREAVAWTGDLRGSGVAARATLLPEGHTITREADEARPRLPVGGVGQVLIEVAPAAVRARLHDRIGEGLGARRIANGRALLTMDGPPPAGPWWRSREVHAVLPVRPKTVRAWLRARDVDAVEFAAHGMPLDADAWWRALGRPPRGPAGWRIELVRLDDGGRVVLTRDALAAAG